MMCSALRASACAPPPPGYSFRLCRREELPVWRALLSGDAQDPAAFERVLTDYADQVYAPQGDAFFERCTFLCNPEGTPVGTCFVWRAYDAFPAIHWLEVLPAYQGQGLGRAVLSHVLQALPAHDYPVFLHTHPSCYRAIALYADLGFALLTDAQIGYRSNDLAQSLPILKAHMPEARYQSLRTAAAPQFFLQAALSSPMEAF